MSRILYISDSAIPSYSANSIHVMKMCQSWALQGHEVTLVAKSTAACVRGVRDIYAFYGVKPAFKLKIVPGRPFPGSGRFYNLFLPFFSFGSYDVVYTRAIYPAFWYSLFGRKFAFEIHEPFETKNARLARLFRFVVRRNKVRSWVVISEALRTHFTKTFGIREQRITVAHDGADPFPRETQPVALAGDFKIGYVGSLLQGKGMELLMPLSKQLPACTFHIVGGQPGDVARWKAVLEPGQQNVVFHGFVPHAATVSYIQAFDLLIAPYQRSVFVKNADNSNNIAQWMSPLKIFEYMSSGKAMITSDLPVLREVLEPGRNAVLCDPDRIADWVKSIGELRENDELRQKLAAQALEDFLAHYTWDKRAEHILHHVLSN